MMIHTVSSLDIAKFLKNLLFSKTGLGRKNHLLGLQFAGFGKKLTTRLKIPTSTANIALSKKKKLLFRPVNSLDEQAKYHIIRYYNIKYDSSFADDENLEAKNKTDEIMIKITANYLLTLLKERFYCLIILTWLKFMVYFCLGFATQNKTAAISK